MQMLRRYVLTLALTGLLSAITSPEWRPRSAVGWLGVAPVAALTYFSAEWAWEAIVSPQRGYRISPAVFSGARILIALALVLPIVATAVAVRLVLGGYPMTVPSNLALELASLGHQTFGERPWARSSTPGR